MSDRSGSTRLASPRFGRYPAYRDSGVEWLGEIPMRWKSHRLKYLVTFTGGGTPSTNNPLYWSGDIPWVSPKDMIGKVITDTIDHITREAVRASSTKLVDRGAVLVVARSGILRHRLPVAIAGRRVALNQDLKALVSRGDILPQYLGYFIAGLERSLLVEWRKEGTTVESLELETMASTRIPVPSFSEQQAISVFLDGETARLDALIAKQETLINLLHEKRTSLISHAVTKGFDPDAPMRDSGVEWLGEIPAHWDLRRLKTLSRMQSGESITSASIESSGRYPVFGGHGLRGYTSDFTHDGDYILIGRQGAHCGNVHLARGRFWASEHAVAVELAHPNVFEWFGAVLEAMDLNRESVAAAQPGLAVDRLRDLVVPTPTVAEQGAIANFLKAETATINAPIAKANEAIVRLQEYRTALISAAVTGQFDVRNHPDPVSPAITPTTEVPT